MNIIDKRRNEAIIDSYYFRIMANGIDLSKKQLQEKFSNSNEQELNNTFITIMKGNKREIITSLLGLNMQASDKDATISNLKEEVKKSLNLSSITEFSDNKKDYFKFKSADGNIFIVRNLGNDSKQLFMDILNNKNIVSNASGTKNTEEIFRFLKNKKFININTENSNNINEAEYTKSQISLIREIENQFPGKQIIVGKEENLYIIRGSSNEDDIILSANMENGKYRISALQQKTYGVRTDKNDSKENMQTTTEIPNDIIIELENNQVIAQTIENGLEMNLSDEEISINTQQVISSRFPNFMATSGLTAIIMELIRRKRENKLNHNKGRQLVLTNNNNQLS